MNAAAGHFYTHNAVTKKVTTKEFFSFESNRRNNRCVATHHFQIQGWMSDLILERLIGGIQRRTSKHDSTS